MIDYLHVIETKNLQLVEVKETDIKALVTLWKEHSETLFEWRELPINFGIILWGVFFSQSIVYMK